MNSAPHILYNEDELVVFLKQKDRSVYRYLYDNYAASLYGTINKIVGDDHTAEDVLQEVFIKIWTKIDLYDPAKGKIYTWMLNIARNSAKDVLRTKGELMKQKCGPENIMITYSIHPQTDTIGIKNMVSKLRPECQAVIEMAYYNGYKIIDIAKELQIPEGTVKTRLREGIRSLRNAFQHIKPQIEMACVA